MYVLNTATHMYTRPSLHNFPPPSPTTCRAVDVEGEAVSAFCDVWCDRPCDVIACDRPCGVIARDRPCGVLDRDRPFGAAGARCGRGSHHFPPL